MPTPHGAASGVVETAPGRLLGATWFRAAFRSSGAPVFVWAVWALMLVAALGFTWQYGLTTPYSDDWWSFQGVLLWDQPLTGEWLWELHNGQHRMPLPRLLLWALYTGSGYDFRAGAFFTDLVLGALAAGLILGVRRLRGWTGYTDAFFPLALLQWGHLENLYWSFMVQYSSSVALALVILLTVIRRGGSLTYGGVLLVGVSTVLLPLCGGNGLGYAPALALWLGYVAVRHWRLAPKGGRIKALLLVTAAAVTLLQVGLYTRDMATSPQNLDNDQAYGSPDLRTGLWAGVKLLSMGFGPFLPGLSWSYGETVEGTLLEGGLWVVLGVGVIGLVLASTGCLLAAWYRQPRERVRAAALLGLLAGVVCLAAGIAKTRGAMDLLRLDNPGWPGQRYPILIVPLLCGLYVTWVIYGPPAFRRRVQRGLFAVMGVAVLLGTWLATCPATKALEYSLVVRTFDDELRAGVPAVILADRYEPYLFPLHGDDLRALRDKQIGTFRYLRDAPPCRELPLEVALAPDAVVPLPEPQYVWGIRLEYTGTDSGATAPMRLFWKRGEEDWTAARDNDWIHLSPGVDARRVTVPIGDTIDQVRVLLGLEAPLFSAVRVVLLLPEPPAATPAR